MCIHSDELYVLHHVVLSGRKKTVLSGSSHVHYKILLFVMVIFYQKQLTSFIKVSLLLNYPSKSSLLISIIYINKVYKQSTLIG